MTMEGARLLLLKSDSPPIAPSKNCTVSAGGKRRVLGSQAAARAYSTKTMYMKKKTPSNQISKQKSRSVDDHNRPRKNYNKGGEVISPVTKAVKQNTVTISIRVRVCSNSFPTTMKINRSQECVVVRVVKQDGL